MRSFGIAALACTLLAGPLGCMAVGGEAESGKPHSKADNPMMPSQRVLREALARATPELRASGIVADALGYGSPFPLIELRQSTSLDNPADYFRTKNGEFFVPILAGGRPVGSFLLSLKPTGDFQVEDVSASAQEYLAYARGRAILRESLGNDVQIGLLRGGYGMTLGRQQGKSAIVFCLQHAGGILAPGYPDIGGVPLFQPLSGKSAVEALDAAFPLRP